MIGKLSELLWIDPGDQPYSLNRSMQTLQITSSRPALLKPSNPFAGDWVQPATWPFVLQDKGSIRPLEEHPVRIRIRLGEGEATGWMWTSDLSHRYVDINAHYRT